MEAIREKCDRLYLPYNLNNNHWIILEVVFRSGAGEFIKVWDGMDTWKEQGDPRDVPELVMLRDVFFDGRVINVTLREIRDPTQERGHGCAAFAFMALCHLCHNKKPFAWTADDEAVCRSFLWGSILKGELLDMPQERVKVVMSL